MGRRSGRTANRAARFVTGDEGESDDPHRPEEAGWERRFWPGFVWAAPLAAALILAYLGLQSLAHAGVDVVATFPSAADARAGDTQVIFKGLSVGRVTKVKLSADRLHVDMTIRVDPSLTPLLRTGSRFWLVGAKPSLADINSLKAALAGVSIGFAPGKGPPTRSFVGLDRPPDVLPDEVGSTFSLASSQVGASRQGAGVFYHGLGVGKVLSVDLLGRNHFRTRIFVSAPYDQYVRRGTLFYNASAVRISLSGSGLSTQFAPGDAALSGGVEFETPAEILDQAPVASGDSFPLYPDRGHAFTAPRGPQVFYRVLFSEPVGDLEVGAAVLLRGFRIGSVTAVSLEVDPQTGAVQSPVILALEPTRILRSSPSASRSVAENLTDPVIVRLVRRGYRARLVQNPPLVGSRDVELAVAAGRFNPTLGARPASGGDYPIIPAADSGDVAAITAKASDILSKVQQVPIAEIGQDVRQITSRLSALLGSPKVDDSLGRLNHTLQQLDALVTDARPRVGPLIQTLQTAADGIQTLSASAAAVVSGDGSGQDASLPAALRQTSDAARALRDLADYLSRHPEALIRGKVARQ